MQVHFHYFQQECNNSILNESRCHMREFQDL